MAIESTKNTQTAPTASAGTMQKPSSPKHTPVNAGSPVSSSKKRKVSDHSSMQAIDHEDSSPHDARELDHLRFENLDLNKKVEEQHKAIKDLEIVVASYLNKDKEITAAIKGRTARRKKEFDQEMSLVKIEEGLDTNGKQSMGSRIVTPSNKTAVVEILRREFLRTCPESAENDMVFSIYFEEAHPELEYMKYVKGRRGTRGDKVTSKVDALFDRKMAIDFNSAIHAARAYVLPDLHQALSAIQKHPFYMDSRSEDRLKIINSCLGFFDSRFSYQVLQLTKQQIQVPILHLATSRNSPKFRQLRFTAEEIPINIETHDKVIQLNKEAWLFCKGEMG